jgi:hypothetical protein
VRILCFGWNETWIAEDELVLPTEWSRARSRCCTTRPPSPVTLTRLTRAESSALDEWLPKHPDVAFLNLNREIETGTDGSKIVYKDGCDLGIHQKLAG